MLRDTLPCDLERQGRMYLLTNISNISQDMTRLILGQSFFFFFFGGGGGGVVFLFNFPIAQMLKDFYLT